MFGTGWSAADLEALQACINNEKAKQQLGSSEHPIQEEGPNGQGEEASEQDPPSTDGQADEEKAAESDAKAGAEATTA